MSWKKNCAFVRDRMPFVNRYFLSQKLRDENYMVWHAELHQQLISGLAHDTDLFFLYFAEIDIVKIWSWSQMQDFL